MKLYELAPELRAVAESTDENGELPPDLEAKLDALNLALEAKAGGLVALWRELLVEAEGLEAEKNRLAKMAQVRKNKAERMKAYLLHHLVAAGIDKVKTPLGTVGVRFASTPKVTCEQPEDLPLPFLKVKTEYGVDRDAVLAAWQAGNPLPPGVTVERTRHLEVR